MSTQGSGISGQPRVILTAAAIASASALIGAVGAAIGGAPGALGGIVVAGGLAALLMRTGRLSLSVAATPVLSVARSSDAPIPSDRIDELTGLANANGLAAWLAEKAGLIAQEGKSIIVMSADLDNFDEIERRYGKAVSDTVLVEVAKRVSTFAGSDGIAARTGGDDFAAIATVVPARALEMAEERSGQLVETLCRPVELDSQTIWIGGAVGAAVGKPSEGSEILKRARAAIIEARRQGRGRFHVDAGDR
jgi:diguanylate cyclase (GGDEF)-like protein